MKMTTRSILLGAMLVGFLCTPQASGQTALYTATLTNAVTANAEHLVLSNWAGITAPNPNGTGLTNLMIDGEVFQVMAIDPPGTNYVRVVRGVRATLRTTHAAGAIVWAAPAGGTAITDTDPIGGCTRTGRDVPYVPRLSIQSRGAFDCMGGLWRRTDTVPLGYDGTAIASGASATVTPPAQTFKISGTSAISAIATPAGWGAGNCLQIIPTGNFTLVATGGNIGKAATAVTGRVMRLCYGGGTLKFWYPSY